MITTDKFTFIHMHKTGGQSLVEIIARSMPSFKNIGYHLPVSETPQYAKNLPIVSFVRNPWDWYVSWYSFHLMPKIRSPLFDVLSNGGMSDFKTTITNLINLTDSSRTSHQYRTALISLMPEKLGNDNLGLAVQDIRDMEDSGMGYYSWLFNRLTGDLNNPVLHVGRFENIKQDFLSIMKKLAGNDYQNIERLFPVVGKQNSSKRGHYSEYFDQELIELVYEKELPVINQYNYHYEQQLSDNPVKTLRKNLAFKKMQNDDINFSSLSSSFDTDAIRKKLSQCLLSDWIDFRKSKGFVLDSNTSALVLANDVDERHSFPTCHPVYSHFEKELVPLLDLLANSFGETGLFVRINFIKLAAGLSTPTYVDGSYTTLNSHRIYVPIITNSEMLVSIGGETKNMRVGEVWEVNNATAYHSSNKDKQETIHLIIDWVPDSTLREQDRKKPTVKAMSEGGGDKFNGVSRNQSCPCGSGKKFKQCHGRLK